MVAGKISLVALIFSGVILIAQSTQLTKIEIHFQEGFNKDLVTLWIEGEMVLQDFEVTSNELIGLGLILIVHNNEDDLLVELPESPPKRIIKNSSTKELSIRLKVGLVGTEDRIDISQGAFLGISKRRNGCLAFSQSAKRFYYD